MVLQLSSYFHSFRPWYQIPDFKTSSTFLMPSWPPPCCHFSLHPLGSTVGFVSCFEMIAQSTYHLTRWCGLLMAFWKLQHVKLVYLEKLSPKLWKIKGESGFIPNGRHFTSKKIFRNEYIGESWLHTHIIILHLNCLNLCLHRIIFVCKSSNPSQAVSFVKDQLFLYCVHIWEEALGTEHISGFFNCS